MSVAAWWLVLNDESRRNAEIETHQQTALLIDEIAAHEVTSKTYKTPEFQQNGQMMQKAVMSLVLATN